MAEPANELVEVDEDLIRAGNIVLNVANYRVSVAGKPVELTYSEFELLRLLAAKLDRVIDFRELTEALWRGQGHREVRRLNVLAFRLRTKLARSGPYEIETVRGRGYGLIWSISERAEGHG
jgi:DNA-binding response OmpR family regulator